MNDEKKGLLKQEFWDMNELSSYISTVQDEDNGRGSATIVERHSHTDKDSLYFLGVIPQYSLYFLPK